MLELCVNQVYKDTTQWYRTEQEKSTHPIVLTTSYGYSRCFKYPENYFSLLLLNPVFSGTCKDFGHFVNFWKLDKKPDLGHGWFLYQNISNYRIQLIFSI